MKKEKDCVCCKWSYFKEKSNILDCMRKDVVLAENSILIHTAAMECPHYDEVPEFEKEGKNNV